MAGREGRPVPSPSSPPARRFGSASSRRKARSFLSKSAGAAGNGGRGPRRPLPQSHGFLVGAPCPWRRWRRRARRDHWRRFVSKFGTSVLFQQGCWRGCLRVTDLDTKRRPPSMADGGGAGGHGRLEPPHRRRCDTHGDPPLVGAFGPRTREPLSLPPVFLGPRPARPSVPWP